MNSINLNSFLKFGYFLEYKCEEHDFSGIDKNNYKNLSEQELIDYGLKLWFETIEKDFELKQKHVVPLSGGLDSRALLSSLLEFTEAKNISTYTFGTPGTYDFEIGSQLAKKTGTNHISFPLTNHSFSIEEELDFSKRSNCQTILFHHPPIFNIIKHYSDSQIWSGYGGDNSAGSHLSNKIFDNDGEVLDEFIQSNTFVKSINLLNLHEDKFHGLISSNFIEDDKLTKLEQLDFNNRQTKYIKPHVLISGFNYKTPFLNSEWFNFILSVDNSYRFNTTLYKKILLIGFPDFFNYPVSGNLGLPMNAPHYKVLMRKIDRKIKRIINREYPLFLNKNLNYLDFNFAIREKDDLKNVIYSSISDLKKRNILDWIDLDDIWNKHQKKQGDFADALITLASLEIHLKNGRKI